MTEDVRRVPIGCSFRMHENTRLSILHMLDDSMTRTNTWTDVDGNRNELTSSFFKNKLTSFFHQQIIQTSRSNTSINVDGHRNKLTI